MSEIRALCDGIRETAYAIHVYHGNGYLEKVYENALVNRLKKAGHDVLQQHAIEIRDEDGTIIGEYIADLIVNGAVLIELKACRSISDEHRAQVLNYLKASDYDHALLINFGAYRFEIQKLVHTDRASRHRSHSRFARSYVIDGG